MAVNLNWVIPQNVRLEIVKTARVQYSINNNIVKIYDERTIINLKCYNQDGAKSRVKGAFNVFQKEIGDKVFLHKKEKHLGTYNTDFAIDLLGRYHVKKKDLMPNLRHIPNFPKGELKIGDTWKSTGVIIFTSFSVPLKLTFPTQYKIVSIKKEGAKNIALIAYSYKVDKVMTGMKLPSDIPKRIIVKNKGTVFWDIKGKQPMDMRDKYAVVLACISKGFVQAHKFTMDILTKHKMYEKITQKDKETAKKEIEKELSSESGIKVAADKRGIALRLGDVLFDFDSSSLKLNTKQKLDKVIGIIRKKYGDRELLVEGHTDNTGGPFYNKRLSKERAVNVAQYVKKQVGHDKLSYHGYGESKPIADNNTKDGRKLNRRVDIIIKLH